MRYALRFPRIMLAATALAIGLTAPGRAQELDLLELVKECDILAAHPADPERTAEGVPDDRIIPRIAIRACRQASASDAKETRFAFQLGRALLAAGKKAEAAAEFRKASEAGHAASWAYLGDAYQFGHEGAQDLQKAFEAYGKAFDGGFEPARGLLEMLAFDEKAFTNDVLTQLFQGQYRDINLRVDAADTKVSTRLYIYSFLQRAMTECDKVVAPANVRSMVLLRLGDGLDTTEPTPPQAADTAAAEFDAQTFIRRHGCEGPVARRLFTNVNTFLSAR